MTGNSKYDMITLSKIGRKKLKREERKCKRKKEGKFWQ